MKQLAANDLTAWLGFPTVLRSDDNLFRAALVHLGSLGIVLNVVVETRPLYFMTEVITPHADDNWKDVLAKQDPGGVPGHRKDPPYLQLIVNPYKPSPVSSPRAGTISMTDSRFTGQKDVETRLDAPEPPNPDLLALVSGLADFEDGGITDVSLRKLLTAQLVSRYGEKKRIKKALPGVIFGPSPLSRGRGESVEFVVDGDEALQATEAIFGALSTKLKQGQQFLGALGIRFVAGSHALLAPNVRPTSCFIELIGSPGRGRSASRAALRSARKISGAFSSSPTSTDCSRRATIGR